MRRVPKLVLSALVALSVALGVAPATALAAEVNSAEGLSEALESGGEITLTDDITVDTKQDWTIKSGVAVELDLNGNSITSTYNESSYYLFTVAGGSLTLNDSSEDGTGKIEIIGASSSYPLQLKGTGSTFTMNGGTITAEEDALDIYTFAKNTTVNINGGTLSSSTYSTLGIRGSGTVVNITGGLIENTGSSQYGAFVSSGSGSTDPETIVFNMTGGKLTSNGTGIFTDYALTVNIDEEAQIETGGVGVSVKGTTVLNVDGGSITSTNSYALQGSDDSSINVTGGSVKTDSFYQPVVYLYDSGSKAEISGGTITGSKVVGVSSSGSGSTVNFSVTGGTFQTSSGGKVDVSAYLPSGMVQDGEGNVTISDTAVAKIGKVGYATLSEALRAAKDGDTVTVLTNITLAGPVTISGDKVTLDLGQKTVSNKNGSVLVVASNSDVTIRNGTLFSDNISWAPTLGVNTDATLTIEDDAVVVGPYGLGLANTKSATAGSAVMIHVYGTVRGVNEDDGTNLLSSGGTVGIGINGNTNSTTDYATIHIYDGAVVSGSQGSSNNTNYDDGPAIYAAGYANWIIDEGATLSGSEALSIKSGDFTIYGGTFIATGTYADPATSWGNGTEATGAAISITNHNSYARNVEMIISGGTFTSQNGYAIYENDTDTQSGSALGADGLSITGGTFAGAENVGAVLSEHAGKFISGGTFSDNLSESGYLTTDVKYEVAHVAGTFSYAKNLADAQALAQPGDGIIDLKATETFTLTLDYNDGATAKTEYKVAANTEVTLPTPTRSGYNFQGWYDEVGNKVEGTTYTVTSNAILTAHWSLIPAPAPATYDVTVADTENGKVVVDKTSASAGDEVTVTATPAEGHEVASVSVTCGEKQVDVTDNGDGTYAFTMPAGDVTVTVAFEASAPVVELPFTDVSDGDWYYGPVAFVYAKGLMTGYEGTTLFGPEDALGREQAAAVLWRALGAGEHAGDCGLPDVSQSEWYAQAVNWAVETGLLTGYDDGSGLFGVGDALTRDQFAAIVARVAKADLSQADPSALDAFSDGGEVAEWAVPAVSWAAQVGILEGSDDGEGGMELRASAEITRGEMATMIQRAAEAGLLPTA